MEVLDGELCLISIPLTQKPRQLHPSNSPRFVLKLNLASCLQTTNCEHGHAGSRWRAHAAIEPPRLIDSRGASAPASPPLDCHYLASKSRHSTRHTETNGIARNLLKTNKSGHAHSTLYCACSGIGKIAVQRGEKETRARKIAHGFRMTTEP
jgi:hypothetical protein